MGLFSGRSPKGELRDATALFYGYAEPFLHQDGRFGFRTPRGEFTADGGAEDAYGDDPDERFPSVEAALRHQARTIERYRSSWWLWERGLLIEFSPNPAGASEMTGVLVGMCQAKTCRRQATFHGVFRVGTRQGTRRALSFYCRHHGPMLWLLGSPTWGMRRFQTLVARGVGNVDVTLCSPPRTRQAG